MSGRTFEPFKILRTLVDHDVRFVVIGGFGAGLRGSPALTGDLDVCYDRRRDNLDKLEGALKGLHPTLRVANQAEGIPFPLDAQAMLLGGTFTLWTDLGPLDILAIPSGTGGYDDLAAGADQMDVGDGLLIWVASIDDLIRMKTAAARPKDQLHIGLLKAVREEVDRAGGGEDGRGLDRRDPPPAT